MSDRLRTINTSWTNINNKPQSSRFSHCFRCPNRQPLHLLHFQDAEKHWGRSLLFSDFFYFFRRVGGGGGGGGGGGTRSSFAQRSITIPTMPSKDINEHEMRTMKKNVTAFIIAFFAIVTKASQWQKKFHGRNLCLSSPDRFIRFAFSIFH